MEISSKRVAYNGTDLFNQAFRQVYNPNLHRKIFKPEWARFKLKYKFHNEQTSDLETCYSCFSLDWVNDYSSGKLIKRSDEQCGYQTFLASIRKQTILDTFKEATIYMTVNPTKDTSLLNYDVIISHFIRGKGQTFWNTQLKYDKDNKVRLDLFK